MLFNSYAFLLFLPIVWIVWSLLNGIAWFRIAQCALVLASFFFYGYQDYRLCFLLAFSIAVNYLFHLSLIRAENRMALKKVLLITGILTNLGLLFYFKYLDFFLDSLNRFLNMEFPLKNIALPLGISFYTFQQLSFVIDSYRGDMGRYAFGDYCLFVAFFPQLIAGPIVLHQELVPQFRNPEKRRINYENMRMGVEYFIIGFAKKILVADFFSRICDTGYDNLSELSSLSAILVMLAFTLQIYFDFSGYCDMALGLGKLFNLELPINFNSPYKALDISDFWKRWHMTLTRFLTTYLYIPLGGNRKGMTRLCLNIMIVFTLSGLWHGAAWTFVLWGMLHGIASVIHRVGKKLINRLPRWLRWLCTFSFVNVAWVFFRAEYFRQPWRLFARIGAGGMEIHPAMLAVLGENKIWRITLEHLIGVDGLQMILQTAMAGCFLFWTAVCVKLPSSHEIVGKKIRQTGYYIFLGVLFTISFMQLSQISKFIYFNF